LRYLSAERQSLRGVPSEYGDGIAIMLNPIFVVVMGIEMDWSGSKRPFNARQNST
jgi:hypothetical protein